MAEGQRAARRLTPERGQATHYRALLFEHWQAHRSLAQKFEDSETAPLSPVQPDRLRTLGYID